jgi:hypothetical protein
MRAIRSRHRCDSRSRVLRCCSTGFVRRCACKKGRTAIHPTRPILTLFVEVASGQEGPFPPSRLSVRFGQSSCTLRFHVATEGGWDGGGTAGLLVAATATEFGLPQCASILLALAGLAAIAILLHRYYAESGRLDPRPVSSASAAPAAKPIPAAIPPRWWRSRTCTSRRG